MCYWQKGGYYFLMLNRIINDVNKALDNEAYFAAIALILTIPDICGKAEYPNLANSKERYIKWYDDNIGQYEQSPQDDDTVIMHYLSGEVVYSLRCSMIHQGNPNIETQKIKDVNNKVDRFILYIEPKNEFDIYCDMREVTLNNWNNQIERIYHISVRRLCLIMCLSASHFYKESIEKFNFFNYSIQESNTDNKN